jgi:hypothetical protein
MAAAFKVCNSNINILRQLTLRYIQVTFTRATRTKSPHDDLVRQYVKLEKLSRILFWHTAKSQQRIVESS